MSKNQDIKSANAKVQERISTAFKTNDGEHHDDLKAALHHQATIDLDNLLDDYLVTRIHDSRDMNTEKLINLLLGKDKDMMEKINDLLLVIRENEA